MWSIIECRVVRRGQRRSGRAAFDDPRVSCRGGSRALSVVFQRRIERVLAARAARAILAENKTLQRVFNEYNR